MLSAVVELSFRSIDSEEVDLVVKVGDCDEYILVAMADCSFREDRSPLIYVSEEYMFDLAKRCTPVNEQSYLDSS